MNGTLGPLYRLFLANIATRGRLIGLVALGAVTILVGFAIGANDTADHLDNGTRMIAFLGLSLVTPVVALVLATSVLGDPNEGPAAASIIAPARAEQRVPVVEVLDSECGTRSGNGGCERREEVA